MAPQKDLDEVLRLVEKLCTGDQVRELLRSKKENENVRITADDKEDLIRKNLRNALEANAIDVQKVYDLIRDAEENGNQHIFYYRATQKLADLLTFEYVAKQLWGASWKKTIAEFPSIRPKPDDYKLSDFRLFSGSKPKDWILKICGEKTSSSVFSLPVALIIVAQCGESSCQRTCVSFFPPVGTFLTSSKFVFNVTSRADVSRNGRVKFGRCFPQLSRKGPVGSWSRTMCPAGAGHQSMPQFEFTKVSGSGRA